MEPSPDDLAGVVDLFGALTRSELERALAELAFKQGEDAPDAAALIDDALATYHLVAVERDEETLLVVGPTAFPSLPEGAEDLPHILSDAGASVDDDARERAAENRFRSDAATAVEAGDQERIATLLDVSYELEVWGDVELAQARERLDDAAE